MKLERIRENNMTNSLWHVGLNWPNSLIGPLHLISTWSSEDQRANSYIHMFERDSTTSLNIKLTTLHSIVNTIERTYISSREINHI